MIRQLIDEFVEGGEQSGPAIGRFGMSTMELPRRFP
jgi:hypothetical protein